MILKEPVLLNQTDVKTIIINQGINKIRSRIPTSIITSGKNFIKITSVGMGAAKSNETR